MNTIFMNAYNQEWDVVVKSSESLVGIPPEHHLSIMKDVCAKYKTLGYTVKLFIQKPRCLTLEEVYI